MGKAGKGSATLSMAYAGARFGAAVLKGLNGTENQECAYVASDVHPGVPYFASMVTFGPHGPMKANPIGHMSLHEATRLKEMAETLKEEIRAGLDYAAENELKIK